MIGVTGEEATTRRSGRAGAMLCRCGFALAVSAVVVLVAAGLGSRMGLWSFRTGFRILTWGAGGGLIAAVAALAGLVVAIRQRQARNGLIALLALATGVAAFAVPVSWRFKARSAPPIHDITTDIDQPPQFVAILPLRKDAPNPAVYLGGEAAIRQRNAYPDIRTAILNLPREEAFARALESARAMGWRIVATAPAEGRIEASDTTLWFGFTDDIVIRVTPAGYRSLVDIRSVSRVGRSDVGTNAKRIRGFVRKLAGSG